MPFIFYVIKYKQREQKNLKYKKEESLVSKRLANLLFFFNYKILFL